MYSPFIPLTRQYYMQNAKFQKIFKSFLLSFNCQHLQTDLYKLLNSFYIPYFVGMSFHPIFSAKFINIIYTYNSSSLIFLSCYKTGPSEDIDNYKQTNFISNTRISTNVLLAQLCEFILLYLKTLPCFDVVNTHVTFLRLIFHWTR